MQEEGKIGSVLRSVLIFAFTCRQVRLLFLPFFKIVVALGVLLLIILHSKLRVSWLFLLDCLLFFVSFFFLVPLVALVGFAGFPAFLPLHDSGFDHDFEIGFHDILVDFNNLLLDFLLLLAHASPLLRLISTLVFNHDGLAVSSQVIGMMFPLSFLARFLQVDLGGAGDGAGVFL